MDVPATQGSLHASKAFGPWRKNGSLPALHRRLECWINPIKRPLGDQSFQDHIAVRKPLRAFLNPPGCLHPGMKDEVSQMEIVGRVMVPRLPGPIVDMGNHVGSRAVGVLAW